MIPLQSVKIHHLSLRNMFICRTAIRRTGSLLGLRDLLLHVGNNNASSSVKLLILSLRLFSI